MTSATDICTTPFDIISASAVMNDCSGKSFFMIPSSPFFSLPMAE